MQQSVCGLTTDRCFDLYDHEIQTIADWALIQQQTRAGVWRRIIITQAGPGQVLCKLMEIEARFPAADVRHDGDGAGQLELIFHWLEIFHHVRVSQLSQSYLFNYQHQETLPPPPLQMAHDYTDILLQQLATSKSFSIIHNYTNRHFERS